MNYIGTVPSGLSFYPFQMDVVPLCTRGQTPTQSRPRKYKAEETHRKFIWLFISFSIQ